jgi:hypothetical protein
MSQALILYTLRPQGFFAQAFAQYLSSEGSVVELRPLSALPPPMGWEERQRRKLVEEKQELKHAIGGFEMGIALATNAPHRFPDGKQWAAQKHKCEVRLKVVSWKLEQLALMRQEKAEEGST